MESLYTKYRPQTFADVVGQGHVVTTLEHAVLEGRTSHAYLFCGPRGTGKTTMARLLAKALMCEQGAGHLPDGTCEQCRLIAAGEHPDVYELDAASRTGVDNVRDEIISRVSFAPVRAAYKMYIIDEVHMLTTAAFNALLKTLEEPPSHVVFVLCTTDPQKIPETILSRVQRFDFHAIGNADIQGRLAYICEREGFAYDPEALELVVRHARGGMRDAISELEQLSVSGGGSITVDVARDVLGEVSASTLERMSLAMAKRDVPTLFAQVESLVEVGRDLLQFTRALAARLRDVYVVAAIGASSDIVAASDDELPAISREAKAFGSVDRVARALALLSDASTEMRVAPNQRLVLEVALTKIARPQSELTLDALADRVASLERQVVALSAPGVRRVQEEPRQQAAPQSAPRSRKATEPEPKKQPVQEPNRVVPVAPQAQPEPQPQPQPQPQSQPQAQAQRMPHARVEQPPSHVVQQATPAQPVQTPAPTVVPTTRQRQQVAPAASATPRPAASTPSPQPGATAAVTDAGELQRRWKQVVDTLLRSHPQHGSLLMNSTIVADDGLQLTVSFPKGSAFACRMLERQDVRANVDPVIEQVFGHRSTRFAEGAIAAPAVASSPVSAPAPAPAAEPMQQVAPQPVPQQRPAQQAPQQTTAPAPQAKQMPAPAVQAQSSSHQPWGASQATSQVVQPAARPAADPRAQGAPSSPQASAQQAPAQQASPYPAPWDPMPLDDDVVPYDDFDASPYEEELAFDPMLASQPTFAPVQAPQQAFQQPVPQQMPAQPRQDPVMPVAQAPAPQSEVHTVPAPQPVPTPKPAPAPTPVTVPTPVPVPAPQPTAAPQQIPEPKPVPTPEPDSAPEKPRRTRRVASAIPTDIVVMMTEIFGEGVTYTAEEPADDESEISDDIYDEDASGSEFVEEPVDDADYDEED